MYTFEEIIGHEDVIEHLQNSIKYNKLSHAYIIDGADSSGKKTIANSLAKTLQCEKGMITPCNKCISCRTFDSKNHPDVIYVKSTKIKSIGVNDIREQVQRDIEIKPYKYNYKIYIIDEAHKLTEQAQNALLKTIEEPPKYALILMLSNNVNKFLPTILSRCIVLKLRPIQDNKIKQYLIEKFQVPDYQADICTAFGQGSLGKAKKLAVSTEFIEMRQKLISIMEQIQDKDVVGTMELYKNFEDYKDNIEQVLNIMYSWYRDLLFIKEFGQNKYIINKDKINMLLKQASGLSYNKIAVILKAIEEAKNQLKSNANFQLVIEMLLLKFKEKEVI